MARLPFTDLVNILNTNSIKKILLLPLFILTLTLSALADNGEKKQKKDTPKDSIQIALEVYMDSIATAMRYETGFIKLKEANATLNVPAGFKFLNAEQSKFVLHYVWRNPPRTDVLGMIFPERSTPFTDSSYAFIISYDDMGYVKDDDAKDINYDDLLKDMQGKEEDVNKKRMAEGYPKIHLIGWAQKPFYDEKKKVLHWAKNLQFDDEEDQTLNYEVRVLGRKGLLSFNAVASMYELPIVNKDIDKVLNMASFDEGNRHGDYNSTTDKIAEYTIGGLVAGKILAKVGFWAMIAKFGKFIIAGIVAAFYVVRNWLTGQEKPEEQLVAKAPTQNETIS